MPREWHDRFAAAKIEDEERRELYIRIAADKKPYFMRYIYPDLMREYNTYIKKAEKNALREFGMTIAELEAMGEDARTDEQNMFMRYYKDRIPVGMNDCVMNRICRRFEQEFDGCVGRTNASSTFDYTIMKSGAEYTEIQARKIRALYKEYCDQVLKSRMDCQRERVDGDDQYASVAMLAERLRRDCQLACPSGDTLCDIILDMCYRKATTKAFAWRMCGEEIVQNLLKNNGRTVRVPMLDEDGEYKYGGESYSFIDIEYKESEDMDDLYSE